MFGAGPRVHCHFSHETKVETVESEKHFELVYAEFAPVVRQGTTADSPIATGSDGAGVIRLTERIIAACRRGRLDAG